MTDNKIKVLHVATWMGRGGLEVWLMEVARRLSKSKYLIDIVVQTDQKGVFDDELKSLGVRVIFCRGRGNPLRFSYHFAEILKEYGPYDVVHSHLHHFSAIPLLVAKLYGVKACIAHSHNIAYKNRAKLGLLKRIYLGATEALLNLVADFGLACSYGAAIDLYGSDWERNRKRQVLHCGVSLSPVNDADKVSLFQMPNDRKIIGHVGRFVPQKNHQLMISICRELSKLRSDFCMVFVGDGDQKDDFEKLVQSDESLGRIIFLGEIDNVREFLNCLDVFLFPSVHEGLGLALVEAQAAGLPCLISDSIPTESHVVKELITVCSLEADVTEWASLLNMIMNTDGVDRELGFKSVESSSFNIENSVTALTDRYNALLCEK